MPSLHSDVKFIGIVNLKIFGVENQPCIKKPETAIGLSHGWDAPCPRRDSDRAERSRNREPPCDGGVAWLIRISVLPWKQWCHTSVPSYPHRPTTLFRQRRKTENENAKLLPQRGKPSFFFFYFSFCLGIELVFVDALDPLKKIQKEKPPLHFA